MKKIILSICLVAALVTSVVGTFAEIDLSNLTLDELLDIQEQVNIAVEKAKEDSESADVGETELPELDVSGYTELTKGSKGDEVKALQTRLFELGFYATSIDGDFGNGTANAIKAFQAFNSLEETGIATPEFQAYLFSDKAMAKPVPVTSINIDEKNPTALVGSTLNLAEMVEIKPDNATEKGVAYEIDSNEYAEIDDEGILIAKERGDVVVTITSKEAVEKPKSVTVKVKVRQPAKTVSLNESLVNIGKGASFQLEATVGPENADDKSVVWTSENSDIATVSSKGTVSAKSCGECDIICTTNDGSDVMAKCHFVITQLVNSIKLSDTKITLPNGKELCINYLVV